MGVRTEAWTPEKMASLRAALPPMQAVIYLTWPAPPICPAMAPWGTEVVWDRDDLIDEWFKALRSDNDAVPPGFPLAEAVRHGTWAGPMDGTVPMVPRGRPVGYLSGLARRLLNCIVDNRPFERLIKTYDSPRTFAIASSDGPTDEDALAMLAMWDPEWQANLIIADPAAMTLRPKRPFEMGGGIVQVDWRQV